MEENELCFLRENLTGAESENCRFRYRFGEKEAEFFFDVKDGEIVSPFTADNDDIWKGDAVEVFLSPDGSQIRYYELEVSPFGVRFWGEISFSGKRKRLKKLPPQFAAEASRTETGYAVHIVLPLAVLERFDRRTARLNAFCIDKKQSGKQKLYALNPTRSRTFHKPEYFLSL